MANIQQTFEYSVEEANMNFEASITSLLDIHSRRANPMIWARQNNKDHFSRQVGEEEILQDFELKLYTRIGTSYELSRQANLKLHKNYKLLEELYRNSEERGSYSCKEVKRLTEELEKLRKV